MFKKIHKSWKEYISFNKQVYEGIEKIYNSGIVYPAKELLFDSFSIPIQRVKVVILGQDPYPNGEGIGYAFAYDAKKFKNKPKSFRNIEKELGKRLNPYLVDWKYKGVMSVNSSMTVLEGKPGSHKHLWEGFTIKWISVLSSINDKIEWVLLGKQAQSFDKYIVAGKKYYAPHPATRYNNFVGCGVFKKMNFKL